MTLNPAQREVNDPNARHESHPRDQKAQPDAPDPAGPGISHHDSPPWSRSGKLPKEESSRPKPDTRKAKAQPIPFLIA